MNSFVLHFFKEPIFFFSFLFLFAFRLLLDQRLGFRTCIPCPKRLFSPFKENKVKAELYKFQFFGTAHSNESNRIFLKNHELPSVCVVYILMYVVTNRSPLFLFLNVVKC